MKDPLYHNGSLHSNLSKAYIELPLLSDCSDSANSYRDYLKSQVLNMTFLQEHTISLNITENIYDSPTGRILLVPQGTRVVGQYDNSVQFGQSRVLLVWNRLIFPNGRSIVLERQPGADSQGFAGLQDGVDYHWWDLARAAGLSTLLNVGAELAVDDQDRLLRAIRNGGQDTINDAGQQIVRRQLNVAPTLTIRPGFPVRVIVTRDLVLEPYGG